MNNSIQIRKKKCPFCNRDHYVEYIVTHLPHFSSNSHLNIYKCPKTDQEFRLKE